MATLKEVFVAGGMPTITYVDREHLNLERNLRSELNEGFKVVAITGPTKSGKTVLCKKIIPNDEAIWIEGGQIEKSEDFWSSIISELDLPTEETVSSNSGISASLKAIIGVKAQIAEGLSLKFQGPTKKNILTLIREQGHTLIVDDFHYLKSDVQKDVIRSLKSEVFAGLDVVLIAVPHRAFDTISAEPEMEGRYAHVNIPEWSLDDLKIIAKNGFTTLGMEVSNETLEEFCCESLGSPLLMQRFCSRLCQHYGIEKTVGAITEFYPDKNTRVEIFKQISKQSGFPTFAKLTKGPQSRSKRNPRRLRDGSGSLDIYQAVLVVVGNTGPKSKLHYDEIRVALQRLLKEVDIPQKHEVSNALRQMENIAKTKVKGEPVLEWTDDILYLTNPFLMFYMRWLDTDDLFELNKT